MSKKIKQYEYKDYTDMETGEIKKVVEITEEVTRQGFNITYANFLVKALDLIGGKKINVLTYIIENMNYENVLYISNRKLANECNVSLQTVSSTLKILRNNNIISTETNLIIVNPKLIHQGNQDKEKYIMFKFKQVKEGDL